MRKSTVLFMLPLLMWPARVSAHQGSLDACDYATGAIPCGEVNRAITEAAHEFGVDELSLRRLVRCESSFRPGAGRRYKGLTQQGASFVRAVYPRFNAVVEPDVFGNPLSPFDNARTAAFIIAEEGLRQWSCRG